MVALRRCGAHALIAASLLLSSGAAVAQNDTTVTNGTDTGLAANSMDPTYNSSATAVAPVTNTPDVVPVREERDRDFPWGLLGLLGLAGLLGRKKKDDIHVDARHDRRDA
jgi:hypothetical protein